MKTIEQHMKHCSRCNRKTVHVRNVSKTGAVGFLVHLVMTVITAGAWLVLLVAYKLLTMKIGGWSCGECGK